MQLQESKTIKKKGVTTLHNSRMVLPWTVQQALMVFGFQMFYGIRLRRFYQHTPAVRTVADRGETCEASWIQFSNAYGLGVHGKLFLVVLHRAAQRISIFRNGLNSLSSMQFGNLLYRNMMI
jgi:hypothetical protein